MALSFAKSPLLVSIAAMFCVAVPAYAEDAAPVAAMYKPANDIESKAQGVLDKHCSRCHATGKLVKREKAAKGFGDVLQLDALLTNTKRVLPGNPDGSPLFQVIVNKQMPYDLYQESDLEKPSVTPEDLTALRDWIVAAGAAGDSKCKPSELTYKDIVNVMYQDLGNLPEHRRVNTRYLSLVNLQASCASDADMDVYRQGAIRLLNSLSTNSDVITLADSLVGEDKLIVRFNLDDLNWNTKLWDEIISHYPYGVRPFDSQYDALTQTTATAIPYVRADWLAFYAARPLLYNQILGLPPTYQELEKQLGLDTFENIRRYTAKRAGFKISGVSQHNRLIERHPISTGYFWTSYDFGGTKTRQNLLEFPLGPIGVFGGSYSYADDFAFRHDGGETIFSLPNGFQGYYLNKADGTSLEKGPTQIVRDQSRSDLAVTNGISCMGCHDQGMKNATDDVRKHIVDNRLLPAEAREGVKALYPEKAEMDKIIDQDRKRFIGALERSGLDPSLKHGTDGEPVNALSNRYERDVDLKTAAAEFGVPHDKVERLLMGGGKIGGSFAAQLAQGTVQRDIFEAEFAGLVESIVDAKFLQPNAPAFNLAEVKSHEVVATPISEFKIRLHTDQPTAKVGEKTIFYFSSTKDCYLTLVNIDSKEKATVLLPNKFSQDNFVTAGTSFEFPSAKDGYDFKFETKGTETVLALCDTTGNSLPSIAHNFTKEEFTILSGESDKPADRSIAVVKRIDDVKAPDRPKAKPGSGGFPPDLARTAIKIQVR